MKKIPLSLLILNTLLFLLIVNPLHANKEDSLTTKIDSILKRFDTPTKPGCAVAIIKNGKVIFKKEYGIANLEYSIPISSSTVFDICSVSKQFTGFAISTLIQEGKISEQDDIRKYLPEIPWFGKTITIKHLLHHTSGLRDYIEALAAAGWFYDEICSFNDVMRFVAHQKELNFDPGSEWSYSNTGYNLLAAIVEKVTKKSFTNWTDENIFKPLHMRSSFFLNDYRKIIKNVAYSYAAAGPDSFIKNPSVMSAYGSGSLFSTIEDLSLWAIHFQKEVAAKNPVYLRMLKTDTLHNGKPVTYGYGLFIDEDRGLKRVWHPGAWAGYRAKLLFYPEEKLSLILLSNADDNNLPYQPVADIFLKDKYQLSAAEQMGEQSTVKVDALLLNKYTGIYQYGPGTMTITLENGQLYVQYSGEDKYPLQAKSDSVFWWPQANNAFTFIREKDGTVNQYRFKSDTGKRVVPVPAPTIAQLLTYTGTYYSEELGSEFTVALTVNIGKGKLTAHHTRLGDFNLVPRSFHKDEFTGFIGTLHFFRNKQQKVIGFKLSGNTVRNIRFDKIIKSYQK